MRPSAGPLLACALLALGGCYPVTRDLALRMVRPEAAFSADTTPPPPRYELPSAWAALPDRADGADVIPRGEPAPAPLPPADCFFVHGTTWADRAGWNQPLDAAAANRAVDEQILPVQAGAFNASCRVYAPRYRQAHLDAFIDPVSGAAAFDLAYGDIERAFRWFLEQSDGRPFLLAGHSQGSRHLLRLVQEHVLGTPLEDRLVAAWLVGWSVPATLPVCASDAATGCVLSWNSEGPKPRGRLLDLTRPDSACVNPLTWTSDEAWGGREHDGAWLHGDGAIVPGVVDARCRAGALEVTRPTDRRFRNDYLADAIAGRDVYHNVDYALFYANIRRNAPTRVSAWLSTHAGAEAAPLEAPASPSR